MQFCWYFECQYPHQFLLAHCLHLLILDLALLSFKKCDGYPWKVYEDMCNVLKNGIQLVNENGMETVVEVLEHCSIVQLVMTCSGDIFVEHCCYGSAVTGEILAKHQNLFPSVTLR